MRKRYFNGRAVYYPKNENPFLYEKRGLGCFIFVNSSLTKKETHLLGLIQTL